MLMPALSSAASTSPFQPAILTPPSLTAREPSAVRLPGKPTKGPFRYNSTASNATIANREPRTIRVIFFFICAESKISASGDYSSPQYNPFWPPPRPGGGRRALLGQTLSDKCEPTRG